MSPYRVALIKDQLPSAPAVEGKDAPEAAASYVKTNNLIAGTYYVQEIPEPVEVEVTVTHEVRASLVKSATGAASSAAPATPADPATPAKAVK